VPRLHAGNHPEFPEPAGVWWSEQLDVHELVTGVARAVDLAGVLDRVEGDPDAAVPDHVDEHLEAAGIQLRD
jgi:hypothetical protein